MVTVFNDLWTGATLQGTNAPPGGSMWLKLLKLRVRWFRMGPGWIHSHTRTIRPFGCPGVRLIIQLNTTYRDLWWRTTGWSWRSFLGPFSVRLSCRLDQSSGGGLGSPVEAHSLSAGARTWWGSLRSRDAGERDRGLCDGHLERDVRWVLPV